MDRVLVMERKSGDAWGYRYYSSAGYWEGVDGGWLAGWLVGWVAFLAFNVCLIGNFLLSLLDIVH